MPTTDSTSNAAEAFLTISNKRQALESLIKIATGIHNQHQALNDLALAAKPSQNFSPKVVSFYAEIERRMADISVSEIIQKLEAIETVTQKAFKKLVHLTTLDVNQLRDDQIDNIDVADFSDSINNFKRRTQTALAFRILLQKRGVAIQPFQLPVSQEDISQQIENLKHKEHQCVQQVKQEINIIIEDTRLLLDLEDLTEEMRSEIRGVKLAMKANLAHLDSGGLVSEIPHVFEVISLESEQEYIPKNESGTEQPETEQPAPETTTPEIAIEHSKNTLTENNAENEKQLSLWSLLKAWLLSPWSTSWQSLKNKQKPDK